MDVNQAVRFARFEDAEAVRLALMPDFAFRSVSHEWIDPGPFNILINGRARVLLVSDISYEKVVGIVENAFTAEVTDQHIVRSVTWSLPSKNRHGSLTFGESVALEHGMVFNCFNTCNA